MELKIVCQCGQKYKFDVEPVGGQMSFSVNCPICNTDGTATANSMLAQVASASPPPVPMSTASSGLKINRSANEPAMASAPPAPITASKSIVINHSITAQAAKPKAEGEFNLGMGILGAFLGAASGAGLMYGFFAVADFRFPLMGTGIGVLTGLGGRMLYKGTDTSLGIISGAIALLATTGTLYMMFGDVAGMFIISIIVSGSFAYKIAG